MALVLRLESAIKVDLCLWCLLPTTGATIGVLHGRAHGENGFGSGKMSIAKICRLFDVVGRNRKPFEVFEETLMTELNEVAYIVFTEAAVLVI
jgi:hypothetical protein